MVQGAAYNPARRSSHVVLAPPQVDDRPSYVQIAYVYESLTTSSQIRCTVIECQILLDVPKKMHHEVSLIFWARNLHFMQCTREVLVSPRVFEVTVAERHTSAALCNAHVFAVRTPALTTLNPEGVPTMRERTLMALLQLQMAWSFTDRPIRVSDIETQGAGRPISQGGHVLTASPVLVDAEVWRYALPPDALCVPLRTALKDLDRQQIISYTESSSSVTLTSATKEKKYVFLSHCLWAQLEQEDNRLSEQDRVGNSSTTENWSGFSKEEQQRTMLMLSVDSSIRSRLKQDSATVAWFETT
ncbi:hypothetical protein BV25DRAFT_1843411 [Artomyces pyxidatus]|uniref:Uncharacterized protein n=1 Tax=Artomyces pyxidatus TaxID=48021 RepID=A0ACB8SEX3_9AGAM|nr:hypothetical protein BV25DRAFT_1843411 [Artomyces pyxidatus]